MDKLSPWECRTKNTFFQCRIKINREKQIISSESCHNGTQVRAGVAHIPAYIMRMQGWGWSWAAGVRRLPGGSAWLTLGLICLCQGSSLTVELLACSCATELAEVDPGLEQLKKPELCSEGRDPHTPCRMLSVTLPQGGGDP